MQGVGDVGPALRKYPETLLTIIQKGGPRGRRKFRSWELPTHMSPEDGPTHFAHETPGNSD